MKARPMTRIVTTLIFMFAMGGTALADWKMIDATVNKGTMINMNGDDSDWLTLLEVTSGISNKYLFSVALKYPAANAEECNQEIKESFGTQTVLSVNGQSVDFDVVCSKQHHLTLITSTDAGGEFLYKELVSSDSVTISQNKFSTVGFNKAFTSLMTQTENLILPKEFVFSPDMCEFSVTFPVEYEPKELIKNGKAGIAANAQISKNTFVQAECWTSNSGSRIEDFAAWVEKDAISKGITVSNVSIKSKRTHSQQVILAGSMQVMGTTRYVKIIFTLGRNSMLSLIILDEQYGSQEQTNIRNSIKKKL